MLLNIKLAMVVCLCEVLENTFPELCPALKWEVAITSDSGGMDGDGTKARRLCNCLGGVKGLLRTREFGVFAQFWDWVYNVHTAS